MIIKSFIEHCIPVATIPRILRSFWIDFIRYIKFTSCTRLTSQRSQENLIAKIVAQYHALEKGLCTPEFRLGFGNSLLVNLIDSIDIYCAMYGY